MMRTLQSPLDEKTVRSLKLGEIVYINGPVITGRDEMHIRAIEKARKGEAVPDGIEGSVLYHCGPIMTEIEGKKFVIAAGPTTSARMNSLESEMIKRFHIRAIIGKGGMSADVAKTMAEEGCVYLAATGGAAVTLAEGLFAVEGVEWENLGMAEAMWKFRTNKLGPLIVAIDAQGNSLYDKVNSELKR